MRENEEKLYEDAFIKLLVKVQQEFIILSLVICTMITISKNSKITNNTLTVLIL